MPILRTIAGALAALAAGTLLASAGTLDDIKARGTLVCGVLGSTPPYGYVNPQSREVEGYEVDLCRLLAEHLGVKAEPKVTSSEARIPELMQGRVDTVSALISYTPERAKQVDYSNSYLRESFGLLAVKELNATKLTDLDGKRIATQKGNFLDALLKAKLPNASMVAFEELPPGYVALQQGKVQALAGRFSSLRVAQIRGGEEARPTAIIEDPIATQSCGFIARKGEDAFLAEVNKFLDKIEASGKAQEVYDKWLGANSPYKFARSFKVGAPVDQ